jgi:glutamyl-tRNA(Gln) amidotransferase subunit E
MEKIDYKALGLKCGVEIHQQLATEKKLYCHCPAGNYSKKYNAEVLRHMRPTLSEMGVYDGTALMEFKTKKEIIYRLNNNTVCTYEMDDTPPFLVNDQAIDIAIEIGLLLGSTIVDEMHIARKQYLDGSIPTGFQRTAIVSMGGEIPFRGRKINIRQFAMEEDACREVSDVGHTITYLTDRLGMPLVEIVTEPDMKTPEEAAAVVKQLGRLMRVTGKVRRGIGTVRQDVNVSITGGTRVEIKGVPRYQVIPLLVHNEALRQKALLEIMSEMKNRNITSENFEPTYKDLTYEFRNTGSSQLLDAFNKGWKIWGIKLPKMSEILSTRTQPGKTFAHELSGRAKVIACIDHVPNLYHTDNWPEYQGCQKDLLRVKRSLEVLNQDAAIIVWGPEEDLKTAYDEIRDRIVEATCGVPGETRQGRLDGTTDFERILPGPDRMYPDTDHPPVKLYKDRVKKIAGGLPQKPWDLEKVYESWKLPADAVEELPISPYVKLIERLSKKLGPKDLRTAGIVLTQKMKALSRKGIAVDKINQEDLYSMFISYGDGKFDKSFFSEILTAQAEYIDKPFCEIVKPLCQRFKKGRPSAAIKSRTSSNLS